MDLTTNGVVVSDAIKYVQGQMDHLNKSEKVLLQDTQDNKTKEEEENIESQKTNNGVLKLDIISNPLIYLPLHGDSLHNQMHPLSSLNSYSKRTHHFH